MEKNSIDLSMQEYYQKRAPEYDDWYDRRGKYNDPATNAAWFSEVADLNRNLTRLAATISHNPKARVLDLACGTGKWTPIFGRALQETGKIVAYDYSPAMLAETRERLEDEDQNKVLLEKTLFVRGDAYLLPFPDSTFDIVFFGFWLSHVPHERVNSFLNEVKRVLKPSGQVFIVDSAQEPGRASEEIANRVLNDGSQYPVLKIRYNPANLQSLLEKVFGQGHASVKQTRRYFLIGVISK